MAILLGLTLTEGLIGKYMKLYDGNSLIRCKMKIRFFFLVSSIIYTDAREVGITITAQCRSIQISLIIDSAVKLFRIQKVIMFHSYSSRHITSLKRLLHSNSIHLYMLKQLTTYTIKWFQL